MPSDHASLLEWILSGEPGDLDAAYRTLRNEAPLLWSSTTDMWVVSRHEDVRRVLESDEFSPLTEGFGTPMIYGRTVLAMTGEEHRKKTALVARRIRNPRRLEHEVQPLLRRWAREMAANLPDDAEAFDLKSRYFTPLPLRVIAHLMGVEGTERFRSWYAAIVAGGMSNMKGDTTIRDRALVAREELFDFLIPRLVEMQERPQDNLLSDLTTMEYEGERLTREEILAFSAFLLVAGIETTERTMTNLCQTALEQPSVWSAMRTNRQLIPPAIAESLRYAPPIHALTRQVGKPVRIHGKELTPRDRVLALIAAANRDESVFDDPDSFVIERFRDNPKRQFTPKSDLLSFGAGEHHCTGSLLALLEMTEAFDALLDRFSSLHQDAADRRPAQGFILRSHPTLQVQGTPG